MAVNQMTDRALVRKLADPLLSPRNERIIRAELARRGYEV